MSDCTLAQGAQQLRCCSCLPGVAGHHPLRGLGLLCLMYRVPLIICISEGISSGDLQAQSCFQEGLFDSQAAST